MTDLHGQRVLVVGMGRSGRAAARLLARRGAVVTVTDQRHPDSLAHESRELMAQKAGLELGGHRETTFLRQDLIVVSPGVPSGLPPLASARRKGIRVVPEIELASWFLRSPIVGITGTNGKTTTTALVGEMLKASGFSPFVGGNIGVPLVEAVEQSPPPDVIVAELSSFQLEIIGSFRPRVAVLLNLTPNHLDRHPTFEAYVEAKARIFENQTAEDHAILNADDPNVARLANSVKSRTTFFSRQHALAQGVFVAEGKLWYRVRHMERALMETRDIRLRGEFNLENALAAATVACVLGADLAALRRAAREFQGVEHRLEFAREIGGVAFYNDSKATSVDASAKALSTFERGVHLILGGKDKGAPYAPLRPFLKDRVKEVLLIGAAQEKIGRELAGVVDLVAAGTIQEAVRRAFERAEAGDTILLSPACSSYDQFPDFEQRGRAFKQCVSAIAEEYQQGKIQPRAMAKPDFLLRAPNPEPGRSAAASKDQATEMDQPAAMLTAQAAVPAGKALARQTAEEPLGARAHRPRELIYVYEVAAEEIAPRDDDGGGPEAALEDVGDLAPTAGIPGDEVMPYEARASGRETPPPRRAEQSRSGGNF